MSFKHSYVSNDYLTSLKIDYSNCDCPLDRKILNPTKKEGNPALIKKIKAKGVAWTRIPSTQYDDIQKQIDELLKADDIKAELVKIQLKDKKDIKRMKYDFIAW